MILSQKLQEKLDNDNSLGKVLSYYFSKQYFRTLVRYAINWKYKNVRKDLYYWIKDLDIPDDVKKHFDKYNKMSDDDKVRIVLKWVHDNITYTKDLKVWKVTEYWQTPEETMMLKTGDCEDGSILAYCILNYLGVPDNKIWITAGNVVGGGHCYVVYMADSIEEFPIDWCYWYSISYKIKIPYALRNNYYGGEREWFRVNKSGSYKPLL